MVVDYFKIANAYIFSIEEHDKTIGNDNCSHDLIYIDGFSTCKICGVVLNQMFKTETDDYKFYEDKQRIRSQYNQVQYVKSHFIDYLINSNSNKLTKNQLFDLELFLFDHGNSYLISDLRFVWVRQWVKMHKISHIHFPEIYCYLFLKTEQNKRINTNMCDNIFDVFKKFVVFHKKTIKNISKRILLYYITKHLYNIELCDYIYGITESTNKKYKKLTDDFFSCY